MILRRLAGLTWVIASTTVYSVSAIALGPLWRGAGRAIGRLWSRQMFAVFGLRVRVHGLDNAERNRNFVFVANHQSHLDIPLLLSILPHRLTFIAKKELFWVPFLGWGMAALGHISIDRSSARKARGSFDRAVQRLRTEGISLVVFPEGTRSTDGAVGAFKRGSFALAIESGLPVVPVAICGTRDALPKKSMLLTPGTVEIRFGAPIDTAGLCAADKESLAEKVRAAVMSLMSTGG